LAGLALAKANTLIREALDISNCFMMFLWGTMDLQGSMAALSSPEANCLLTRGFVRMYTSENDKKYFLQIAISYGKRR